MSSPGGKQVMIPGEIEVDKERVSAAEGIEIPDTIIRELREVGKEYGVEAAF